jgi:multimeric flavodoxin WrbA
MDDMQNIYLRMLDADGIIFGTPVYFWSVAAQAKILIDRTYVFKKKKQLRQKVAGGIVVARRAGATSAFSLFLNFFNSQRMTTAGGAIAYADAKGEVRSDPQGMSEARALGKAMARTINHNI